MTNPTDPAAAKTWQRVYSRWSSTANRADECVAFIQAYGDQREKAAVERVVAWLREQAERQLGHQPDPEQPGYEDHHYAARTGAYNALHVSALKIERGAHKEASDE